MTGDSDVAMLDRAANGQPKRGGSPLDIFDRLASVEGADIEKLSKLLDMDRQWRADRAKESYLRDLVLAQAAMPKVVQTGTNTQTNSRYATLETILPACKPVWERFGFSMTFSEGEPLRPELIRTVCVRGHKEGHTEEHWIELPRDGIGPKGNAIGGMNAVQGSVSSGSYGQRVLTCRVWNIAIVGEDRDGQTDRLIESGEIAELESLIEQFKDASPQPPFNFKKFLSVFGGPDCERLSDLALSQFQEASRDLRNRIRDAKRAHK